MAEPTSAHDGGDTEAGETDGAGIEAADTEAAETEAAETQAQTNVAETEAAEGDVAETEAAEGEAGETDVDGRVTEVGPVELIDTSPHPTAAIVGGVLLVLVTVLVAVGLGSLVAGEEVDRPGVVEVIVPRLSSRPMADAQAQLERLGLIVDIRFEPNEIVPREVVVAQEPIAGARMEVGEQVVLVVSDGPVGITVPDLTGHQVAEARRALGVLGLQISTRELHHEEVPQGEIIRSDPAAGDRAEQGGTVTVAVSLGPEPRTVPDVVGRPTHEAFAEIGRAELQIARVTERRVSGDRVGTVLSLDPGPGSKVPRDQPIRVVVGVESGSLEVPDVVGLLQASARAALSELGLTPRIRTEAVPPGDRRNGRVMRQTPVAGGAAASGDEVTIFVGAPPAPTTTAPPASPPAQPDG